MSLQALATSPDEPQSPKKTRISKRLAEAIRLLTTPECKTQKDAAEKAGLNVTYLCEALKKPEVRVFIERQARENVAITQLRASAKLGELLDCGSKTTEFDATRLSLAIAGIKPSADAQVSVNIDIKAGYVIDLTDGQKPPAITIEHE